MPSLKAFQALDKPVRMAIINRIIFRKRRFLALQAGTWQPAGHILLVGDRPAPSAPDDPNFHYTPFGALWNSSLWVNQQLEQFAIDEDVLGWVNSADLHGKPLPHDVLKLQWSQVIALGGNASKWLRGADVEHQLVQHPQAWKRFHGKEPYPLIGLLSIACC
jgi:hypothetical protein